MNEKIYSGKILDFSVHEVVHEGRKLRREMVEHGGAAAMIGFDEDGKIILVRQYRYPHGYILEIPAGTLEKGEDPIDCAKREMREETGYQAKDMRHFLSYYPSIGYNTEIIHCYEAVGLVKAGEIKPDTDEFITVVKMQLNELVSLIRAGKVQDSKTICAVMTYIVQKKIQAW